MTRPTKSFMICDILDCDVTDDVTGDNVISSTTVPPAHTPEDAASAAAGDDVTSSLIISHHRHRRRCIGQSGGTPDLTIFGTKMANSLKLYEVHSFSTSYNSCQCTTMLNADVPNCYITL